MFCNKCGNKLIDNATFCTICGEKVEEHQKKVARKKKKGNGLVIILLILVNIVLVLSAIWLGWKYFMLHNTGSDYEETTSEMFVSSESSEISETSGMTKIEETTGLFEEVKTSEAVEVPEVTESTKEVEVEKNSSKLPSDGVQIQYTGMEGTIQQLINSNVNFSVNMYHFGSLPTVGDYVDLNLKKVDTAYFASFNEYVAYVHSIYKKERADKLIHDAKYFGGSNGELLLNTAFGLTGTEYNIDWSCYVIEIVSQTNNECEFVVTTRKKATASNPNPQDYVISGKAVLENGRWLLEKEIY